MKQDALEQLAKAVDSIEAYAGEEGGSIDIFLAPGARKRIVVCGDRVALIRFSVAILRYAVDARIDTGRFKSVAKVIRAFRCPPSRVEEFFIQLDETPPSERVQKRDLSSKFGWLTRFFEIRKGGEGHR